MSYTIAVQIYQTNPSAEGYFNIVEKTVFANGTWSESPGGVQILTINNSGTSGSLRFISPDTGENFIVTLGVHNYKPWGDIVTKLDPATQTGVKITPEYYETEWGGSGNSDRVAARWKTLPEYEVTRDGRTYGYKFVVTEGHQLKVNVVIG